MCLVILVYLFSFFSLFRLNQTQTEWNRQIKEQIKSFGINNDVRRTIYYTLIIESLIIDLTLKAPITTAADDKF